MTHQEENMDLEDMFKKSEKSHARGKVIGGILVVIAGSLYLAKELGADIPHWLFTWKTFLIAIGIITGVKHNFRNAWWFFLVAIGSIFLVVDFYPELNIKQLLWPILIILFGIIMIFKPRGKHKHRHWAKFHEKKYGKDYVEKYNSYYEKKYGVPSNQDECFSKESSSTDDYIEFTTFMGSVKKNILSKNFKGGEISNVFGGTELNLSQADIDHTATLELDNVFGGTRLVIPANWEVHSESVSVIMGTIEDKRSVQAPNLDNPKILILKGTTVMGGIEIKSY
jgi:predicted membrane protein